MANWPLSMGTAVSVMMGPEGGGDTRLPCAASAAGSVACAAAADFPQLSAGSRRLRCDLPSPAGRGDSFGRANPASSTVERQHEQDHQTDTASLSYLFSSRLCRSGGEFNRCCYARGSIPRRCGSKKVGFMGNDHVSDVQVLEYVDEAVPGGFVETGGGFIQQEQPAAPWPKQWPKRPAFSLPRRAYRSPGLRSLPTPVSPWSPGRCATASAGGFPWFKGPKATSSRTVGQKSWCTPRWCSVAAG